MRLEMLLPWKHSPPSWRSTTDQFANRWGMGRKTRRKGREEESRGKEQWDGVGGRGEMKGTVCVGAINVCTYPICDTMFTRSKVECFSLRNLRGEEKEGLTNKVESSHIFRTWKWKQERSSIYTAMVTAVLLNSQSIPMCIFHSNS